MLWETINVMRDISRLHDITSVMIRYGGGDFVRLIGIGNILERAGRILYWKEASEISQLEPAVRVRRALEELGPTFVKLGQVLATRVDIFPPNWIAEFEKLQSEVPPVPFEILLPDLQKALGKAPDEIFLDLHVIPFAAASIAQVHLAKLKDGTPVVLKIRRPGIESVIEADLRILAHIARLIESEIPESRRYQPSQVVSQFKRSLRRELDFAMEARNIDRFRINFQDDPTVVVPQVYWEYTSEIMNVQEAIQGIPGTNLKKVDESGLDRKLLAARGADAVLKMIMIHGYFHADPHPGNVFYLSENRIGIIDFGMVGRITDFRRNQIVNLLYSLAKKDEEGMLDVLMDWTGDSAVNEAKLATDVSEFVFNFDNVQLKDLRLGPLLSEITVIMRENELVLPSDLTLLFKALITLEGLGQQLDPEFHMLEHLTPFVRSVITDRYKPAALLKRGQHGLKDVIEIATGLPRDLAKLLREARRGKLKIDLDLKRLDHFGSQLDRSTNRLTLGILTASLVIGSSIVMTVKGGPTVFGLPLFGLLGFFVAFLNSIWIVFSIWRSGKE